MTHAALRRAPRAALVLAAVALASACATPQSDQARASGGAYPRAAALDGVPFHAQRTQQCGPAALAMLLGWNALPGDPDALAGEVFTPARRGSFKQDLVGAGRRRGLLVYELAGFDALLRELAAGHPVLVLQNLALSWFPVWHYAVAIGYDLDHASVTLHSGTHAHRELPLSTFERTWRRAKYWGLVALPAGALPASAHELPYLEAALGLERVQRPAEAERAFATATQRWPSSLGAWMGLGNVRYARGELAAAEQAFRAASAVDPASVAALNNLAQVLAERGDRDEARATARRALALGGPLRSTVMRTLEEIEADRVQPGP